MGILLVAVFTGLLKSGKLVSPANTYKYINLSLKSMPDTKPQTVVGVQCPECKSKGKNVWVIPGNKCPECGTKVGTESKRSIHIDTLTIFACGFTLVSVATGIYGIDSIMNGLHLLSNLLSVEHCDAPTG